MKFSEIAHIISFQYEVEDYIQIYKNSTFKNTALNIYFKKLSIKHYINILISRLKLFFIHFLRMSCASYLKP